jgi:predicted nucleotidyltransferase
MTQQLSAILQNLRHQMEILYQDRLHSLILFGSQARGDANLDSDIDILIVLKDDIDSWTEIKRTGGIISQICLDNSILVTSLFVSVKQFITQDTALFRNIKKEGKYI